MKSNIHRIVVVLIAAFVGMAEVANAFYDPGLQRWINRDPIGEEGFTILHSPETTGESDGPNLYAFVGNDPGNKTDSFGLISYAPGTCSVIEKLKGGNCMWQCTCPAGYSMGFVRSVQVSPCNRTPSRTCFKLDPLDYCVLAGAAILSQLDSPAPGPCDAGAVAILTSRGLMCVVRGVK